MRRIVLPLLIAVLALVPPIAAAAPPDASNVTAFLDPVTARRLYRSAHEHLRAREWDVAEGAFSALAEAGPLSRHAQFYRGMTRLKLAELPEACQDFAAVAGTASGGLRDRALLALGEASLRRQQWDDAVNALSQFVHRPAGYPIDLMAMQRSPHRAEMARAWVLLGDAYRGQGRPQGAADAYAVAGWGYYETPEAVRARRLTIALRGRVPRAAALPALARLGEGQRLYAAGEFAAAEAAVERAADGLASGKFALTRPAAAQAWFLLGHLRLWRGSATAAHTFERSAQSGGGASPQYWQGRALLRARRMGEAARVAAALAPLDPARSARLWVDLAGTAQARGDLASAGSFLRRAAAAGPLTPAGDEARWRRGWLAWRQGRDGDARTIWLAAADTYPGSWRAPASLVWAARLVRDREESRELLLRAAREYPWHFSGELARRRLGLPVSAPQPPRSVDAPPDRYLPLQQELLVMGFAEDAADAAAAAGDLATEARALGRLGRLAESIRRAEQGLPGDETLLGEAYPRGTPAIEEAIARAARAAGVEPALLRAVIREESRFMATAVSSAGAVGLMQLLPSTARGIVRRRLSWDELTDPHLNVRLGSAYLAGQLRSFRGNVLLALVAYNAGPGNARRLARVLPLSDTEQAIERIPIRETRQYVAAVLQSFAAYRHLGYDAR